MSSVFCVLKVLLYDLIHNSVSTSSTALQISYPHTPPMIEKDEMDLVEGKNGEQDFVTVSGLANSLCRLLAGRDFIIAV